MHRCIVMSQNLVTEIKKNLTRSKIGTQIAFHRDTTVKIQICLFIPPQTQEPSPSHRLILISIWRLAGEAICRGKRLPVDLASLSALVANEGLQRAQDPLYWCSTAASQTRGSYVFFVVEVFLAAIAILCGQCEETANVLEMSSVRVPLYHHPFGVERLPKPSIRVCRTSWVYHRSSRLHPPILVVSIRQASSATAKTSPCAA